MDRRSDFPSTLIPLMPKRWSGTCLESTRGQRTAHRIPTERATRRSPPRSASASQNAQQLQPFPRRRPPSPNPGPSNEPPTSPRPNPRYSGRGGRPADPGRWAPTPPGGAGPGPALGRGANPGNTGGWHGGPDACLLYTLHLICLAGVRGIFASCLATSQWVWAWIPGSSGLVERALCGSLIGVAERFTAGGEEVGTRPDDVFWFRRVDTTAAGKPKLVPTHL